MAVMQSSDSGSSGQSGMTATIERRRSPWLAAGFGLCAVSGLLVLSAVYPLLLVRPAAALPRPALIKPRPMATPRTHRLAAPRHARLKRPISMDTPAVNLLEARMDGTMAGTPYYAASVDFTADPAVAAANLPSGALGFAADQTGPSSPFPAILSSEATGAGAGGMAEPQAQIAPLFGHNHSVDLPSLGGAVHRLVLMPRVTQRLDRIEADADVRSQDLAAIGRALGRDSLQPGQRLEVLYREATKQGEAPTVLLARYSDTAAEDRLVARLDSGGYAQTRNRDAYRELLAQAMADNRRETEVADADDDSDRAALAKLRKPYPDVVDRLTAEHLPAHVAVEVCHLLVGHGISGARDLSRLHIVFRKGESGQMELVSLEIGQNGKEQSFYRFRSRAGHPDEFLDANGRSADKPLLGNPVPGSRRNDGFGWRMHPILHRPEFHNGVDFDAPLGTPILAAGDGVVTKISSENGYGKYVRVRHDHGFTTTYAHISGTAKGLTVGDRVEQGQVIAYIGSTGLSTGPHLYYELRMGDKTYADPTRTRISAGTELRGDALEAFKRETGRVDAIATFMVNSAKSVASAVGNGIASAVKPLPGEDLR